MHYMRVRRYGIPDDPNDPVIRFWKKVERRGPNECWPWLGWRNQSGYGQFHVSGRLRLPAHVYAWKITHGDLPPDKPWGLHHCDNPPCCNPSHIFPGTSQDNVRDRHAKGRDAKGNRHGMTKLSEEDIVTIRRRLSMGDRYDDIARDFHVAKVTIASIKRGVRRRA